MYFVADGNVDKLCGHFSQLNFFGPVKVINFI